MHVPSVPQTALTIAGSDQTFPAGRLFCVGRNYADHAREMGHDPNLEPPFFFSKHASCATQSGQTLPYPAQTSLLHHEAELVVALGKGGKDLRAKDALDLVWGYAAGNDLTRRDLQAQAKELRRPWDMAKNFDHSAILGDLHSVVEVGHLDSGRITARIDGALRQDGDLSQMLWPVAELIAHLSRFLTLMPGDLIMTGTPAGVGPIARGERCVVSIDGLSPAEVTFE